METLHEDAEHLEEEEEEEEEAEKEGEPQQQQQQEQQQEEQQQQQQQLPSAGIDVAALEDNDQPRIFRSGKGPAEQAYDTFLKEMGQWRDEQETRAAQRKTPSKSGRRRAAAKQKRLELDSSGSDTDLEDVQDFPRRNRGSAPTLEQVYQRACTAYGVTALSQFKFQLHTKQVSITNMSLREKDVAAMSVALERKDDVTYIGLSGNLIGPGGLDLLLQSAKQFRTLTTLDISGNHLDTRAAQLLQSRVDTLRSLRCLYLADNCFMERDAEYIAALIGQLDTLRLLDASNNTFGSWGGELLGEALRTNSSLETLALAGCQIRMQGAAAIGNALRENGSLDVLDVSYNGFADEGAAVMARALTVNTSLSVLNLTANRIFVAGATALGEMLAKNESLRELYLDKNSFTCKGAEELLAKLKENENTALKILDMKNVSVTYNTAAAVLPSVQHPLLLRCESFLVEPGSLQEQLNIPGGGSAYSLSQKLHAEAEHVLRVFTNAQRLSIVRLAKEAAAGRGDGVLFTEAEFRRLLLSLPIRLLEAEVDALVDGLAPVAEAKEPIAAEQQQQQEQQEQEQEAQEQEEEEQQEGKTARGGVVGQRMFSLNSLLTLGDPNPAKWETQH